MKKLWGRNYGSNAIKKWATAEEVAEWVWMFTVVNKSCTGQDLIIDNGEKDLNNNFKWPNYE